MYNKVNKNKDKNNTEFCNVDILVINVNKYPP